MASRQQTLKLGAVAIAAAVLTQVLSPAVAAPITWGAAQDITGTGSQVLTTGTLFLAVNFNGSIREVNGVNFAGLTWTSGSTASSTNLSISAGKDVSSSNTNTPVTVLTNSNYRDIVGTNIQLVGNSTAESTINYTISNLVIGQQYVVQFWSSNARPGSTDVNATNFNRMTFINGGPSLLVNTSATSTSSGVGGVGQFAAGTFTADATTQTISTFGGQGNPSGGNFRNQPSAIQIRAVPEPSTLALASLGIVGIGTWFSRRRMRRAAEESTAADAGTTA